MRQYRKKGQRGCENEKQCVTLQRLLGAFVADGREPGVLGLSYGVMVALQFLVLPVQVRILVRQPCEGLRFPVFGNLRLFLLGK